MAFFGLLLIYLGLACLALSRITPLFPIVALAIMLAVMFAAAPRQPVHLTMDQNGVVR